MTSQNASSPVVVPPEFDFKLYRYTPSLVGASVAAAVFFILTTVHCWRMARTRAFYFVPFLIGVETVGYCGRIWSHFDEDAIGGFVMQAILILVAPALYAASIYMILGRLIRSIEAEQHSLIPIKWLTKVFVTGDIVSFSLQAGGGGIQAAGTLELYNIGEKIIIAGLLVQIVIFGFFVIATALFNVRFVRCRTVAAERGIVPWRRHLTILYATSGLILVRSIFRVIEYLQGNSGYLISHEIFLYVFDACLMAVVMVLFALWYIGDLDTNAHYRKHDLIVSSSADAVLEDITLQDL